VRAGESLLLRGSNGAGKTTLLRCLASSVRPTSGAVWWFGHRVCDDPSLRRLIGMVAHESRLYPQLTLRENLLLAARLYAVDAPGGQADRLLDETGMAAHANRRPAEVSRGMRQRVSVARTLIHQPRILLLDEPFSGLDLAGRGWLRQQLAGIAPAGPDPLRSDARRGGGGRSLGPGRPTAGRPAAGGGQPGRRRPSGCGNGEPLAREQPRDPKRMVDPAQRLDQRVARRARLADDAAVGRRGRLGVQPADGVAAGAEAADLGGLLWLAVFFAGLTAVDRSFAAEREEGCWEGLKLLPIPPSVVYLAKLAVNFTALTLLECLLIPLFFVLSDVPLLPHLGRCCPWPDWPIWGWPRWARWSAPWPAAGAAACWCRWCCRSVCPSCWRRPSVRVWPSTGTGGRTLVAVVPTAGGLCRRVH
jgi:ABC-type transport system involved in cytochrome c biogenesis ATPase subunit